MRAIFLLLALIPGLAFSAGAPRAADSLERETLVVFPLDSGSVNLAPGLDPIAIFYHGKSLKNAPMPGALVARGFHPAFGAAVAKAARRILVADSSAASPRLLHDTRIARIVLQAGDTLSFNVPATAPDSARFGLFLGNLDLAPTVHSVPRHFVSPTRPTFDPATGESSPGDRDGHMEGPGRFNVVSASAAWVIWDYGTGKAYAQGRSVGSAESRGNIRRSEWEEAARELAKNILRQTPFTPF